MRCIGVLCLASRHCTSLHDCSMLSSTPIGEEVMGWGHIWRRCPSPHQNKTRRRHIETNDLRKYGAPSYTRSSRRIVAVCWRRPASPLVYIRNCAITVRAQIYGTTSNATHRFISPRVPGILSSHFFPFHAPRDDVTVRLPCLPHHTLRCSV